MVDPVASRPGGPPYEDTATSGSILRDDLQVEPLQRNCNLLQREPRQG